MKKEYGNRPKFNYGGDEFKDKNEKWGIVKRKKKQNQNMNVKMTQINNCGKGNGLEKNRSKQRRKECNK